MRIPITPLLLSVSVFLFSACESLDITPQAQGDRVLTGTVNFRAEAALLGDAVATVRLLDVTRVDLPPQVIAEQSVPKASVSPVPFSLSYKAEDILPPKRVRIEARISVGGKLRYCSVNSVVITPAKAEHPFEVWIESVKR